VESAPLIAPPPLAAAVAASAPAGREASDVPETPLPAAKSPPPPKAAKAKAAPKAKPQSAAKPAPKAAPAAKAKATTTGWTTKPGAATAVKAPAAAAAEPGPKRLSAPRGGKADDLKLISGIGPKLEAMCNRLGIYHFDQIAAWTPVEVFWMDDNLEGFKGRVSRDDWVAQARSLAAAGAEGKAGKAAKR
jgi:predicted flap endonuclease-1-like 5' DNA nuclease